jgi:Fur family zinc uptake transcriptional regulator
MGDSCHHTHHDGPPDVGAVRLALGEVERRLADQGERMTTARSRVLELLLSAGEPMKAYDLIARFGTDGVPAKPPTVYRSLEFLERHGLVHPHRPRSAPMSPVPRARTPTLRRF